MKRLIIFILSAGFLISSCQNELVLDGVVTTTNTESETAFKSILNQSETWTYIYRSDWENLSSTERMQIPEQVQILGISDVLLSVDVRTASASRTYRSTFSQMVSDFHSRGITVRCMIANGTKYLDDVNEIDIKVGYFIKMQGKLAADSRFDGVHVDIEPHAHPDWKTSGYLPDETRENLMQQMLACFERLNLLIGDEYECSADIAHWLHHKYVSGDLITCRVQEWLQYIDIVCIMAYDDDYLDVKNRVAEELNAVPQYESSIIVSIKSINDGKDDETFYEEGWSLMKACDDYLDAYAFSNNLDAYRGVGYYKFITTWEIYNQ